MLSSLKEHERCDVVGDILMTKSLRVPYSMKCGPI